MPTRGPEPQPAFPLPWRPVRSAQSWATASHREGRPGAHRSAAPTGPHPPQSLRSHLELQVSSGHPSWSSRVPSTRCLPSRISEPSAPRPETREHPVMASCTPEYNRLVLPGALDLSRPPELGICAVCTWPHWASCAHHGPLLMSLLQGPGGLSVYVPLVCSHVFPGDLFDRLAPTTPRKPQSTRPRVISGCALAPGSEESLVNAVRSLSRGQLFATPWTAACQAPLSFTISRSLLRFKSIELVMPSSHLILCRPLLLWPLIFPSIRVFSMSRLATFILTLPGPPDPTGPEALPISTPEISAAPYLSFTLTRPLTAVSLTAPASTQGPADTA